MAAGALETMYGRFASDGMFDTFREPILEMAFAHLILGRYADFFPYASPSAKTAYIDGYSFPRFFLTAPLPSEDPTGLPLTERDVHHIASVLRMRPGDEIVAVEFGGEVWAMRLFAVTPQGVMAGRIERLPHTWEPQVVLVQGVGKGDKIDEVVEGAVEVGVAEVLPVLSARSVVKYDAEKRAARGERWRRVAEAAAKQSQRSFVPYVSDPVDLGEALPAITGCDVVLVAWEGDEEAKPLVLALERDSVHPIARAFAAAWPEVEIPSCVMASRAR